MFPGIRICLQRAGSHATKEPELPEQQDRRDLPSPAPHLEGGSKRSCPWYIPAAEIPDMQNDRAETPGRTAPPAFTMHHLSELAHLKYFFATVHCTSLTHFLGCLLDSTPNFSMYLFTKLNLWSSRQGGFVRGPSGAGRGGDKRPRVTLFVDSCGCLAGGCSGTEPQLRPARSHLPGDNRTSDKNGPSSRGSSRTSLENSPGSTLRKDLNSVGGSGVSS